ncbi:MAG TPA: hypothetical protein VJR29_07650 [bacterium]|nr:hypothetical protein [bacterium]
MALCLFTSPLLWAAPLALDQVPEPLKPWVSWVLHGEEERLCPNRNGDEERLCAWASRLDLNLDEKQGSFAQDWELYRDDWVPLPGDAKRWPQSVTVDGQAATVLDRDGVPSLFLKKGSHAVKGAFLWDSLPENFQIPSATGILQLILKGQAVPFPQLDENGLLWLEKESVEAGAEERLDLRVNRMVDDEIPLFLTTVVELDVAGKAREVKLGRALPQDFIMMSLDSPLPARVELDGSLKVQVRPGNWKIEIKARAPGPVAEIALSAEPALVPEEVWVFQAHNNLRLVSIEGVSSIDPQQTTLPEHWKQLPAYRLKPGETMRLVERRRGDSDPAPDQLTLFRRIWLDFDGQGYTFQDALAGTLNRSNRLEMNAPLALGRVSINGVDQLITSLPGEKRSGIEIRQGNLQVSADSRLNDGGRSVPAIGWNHDFQKVSGELQLPPGWGLWAATGADEVPGTWIARWNLLNIFMVLILFLIFARLWGIGWGLVALLGLTLTYTEIDAPQWSWLALLAGCALLRLLKPGKLHTLARVYTGIATIVLLIVAIPFMVQQLRQGMYPVLEHPYQVLDAERAVPPPAAIPAPPVEAQAPEALGYGGAVPQEAPASMDEEAADSKVLRKMAAKPEAVQNMAASIGAKKRDYYDQRMRENLSQQSPGAKVQTGPGLPLWTWNHYPLTWNGPVEKGQTLRLFLIPPALNFALAVLRVLLVGLLALCVLGWIGGSWQRWWRRGGSYAALLLIAGGIVLGSAPARAEYPPTELLNQLRDKLLEDPECYPDCAAVSRMRLAVAGNQLRLLLEVGVAGNGSVALPGSFEEWTPASVTVNGRAFSALHRDETGNLWIQLPPGVHQVTAEGPLPERPSVQIALPLKPRYIEAEVADWSLEGLLENGQAADNLQLTRLQSLSPDASEPKRAALPPFFRVERLLLLGLTWEVETKVVRLTPPGTAFIAEVPLLAGESVTDADVEVKEGKVRVSMGPNATEFTWRSVLAEAPELKLEAPKSSSMIEVWQLDLNPVWHYQSEGIPPVHPGSPDSRWPVEWRPWPGETLNLKISRPAGIAGQVLTIDRSRFAVTPGLRFTESSLSVNLRSSLGGQHVLTLPEGAVLQSVSINGSTQPIRQEGLKVSLPLVPGTQQVELRWQQPLALKSFFRTPAISLGSPSVNTEIQLHLPQNRWVLFAGGLRAGPAVLFWSMLGIVILASIVLGRSRLTPLKFHHWLLLGFGLTQVPIWASLIFAGWLLALGWRERKPLSGSFSFDLFQILLALWTLAALIVIFVSIQQGLLGMPDMQISGNGSSNTFLRWFNDRSPATLPQTWVISVPLFCYRLAMLAWALWLALALLRWLRWAWASLTSGGGWKALRASKPVSPPPPAA